MPPRNIILIKILVLIQQRFLLKLRWLQKFLVIHLQRAHMTCLVKQNLTRKISYGKCSRNKKFQKKNELISSGKIFVKKDKSMYLLMLCHFILLGLHQVY